MEETIRLTGVDIGYRDRRETKTVARGLSAVLQSGEMTCLLGANGVGKSTLLRTLSAFQPPLAGEVSLFGKSLARYSQKELAKTIGVVLTVKLDVQNMTAHELVGIGRSPYTGFWGTLSPADEAVVADALAMVGISRLGERTIHTLSDGERQKVMIAKALAQQTPVIFLDEPTAFLDFPSKVEMMQLLRRLAHEMDKTVFLSTHDLELALQLADRLWLMEPDNRLSIGTPAELAAAGALSRYVERKGIVLDRASLTIHVGRREAEGSSVV